MKAKKSKRVQTKRRAEGLGALPLPLQRAIFVRLLNHTLENTKKWLARRHRVKISTTSLSEFLKKHPPTDSLRQTIFVPATAARGSFTVVVEAPGNATVRVEFPAGVAR